MIEFLTFLLVVCAAGFIYLTFRNRWQVKDDEVITTTLGATKLEQRADSITITADKINLNGAVSVTQFEEEYVSSLPKSAPRINQAHWQTRTFERPRRKVKR